MWFPVVLALVPLSGLVALMLLTGLGARRRGQGLALTCVAAILFPVTWAVWYVRDEHPYRAG